MQPEFQRSLDVLVGRLADAFPELDMTEIRTAVAEGAHALADARLPQFVPLLVEKQARAACRERRRTRASVPEAPLAAIEGR